MNPKLSGFYQRAKKIGSRLDQNMASKAEQGLAVLPFRHRPAELAFTAADGRAVDLAALRGKVVVRLTIAPSGAVTACELVSSELGDPDLERKVIQRVKLLNFGRKNVPEFTYPNYPIIFLPT